MKITLTFLIFSFFAGAGSFAEESQCSLKLSHLDYLMNEYAALAKKSDSSGCDSTYQQIHGMIFDTSDKSDLACSKTLMAKYLIDSAKNIGQTRMPGDKAGGSFLYDKGERISKFVLALYQSHKIQFLTQEFRNENKGHWLDQLGGKYTSLGGYDCASSTLFIDPTLRPLDLTITLFHELDHFVRDKTTEEIDADFLEDGRINWNAYNLDDEVSAISLGASAQADLQNIYYSGIGKLSAPHPFKVKDDLTLFSDHGLFHQIFEENHGHDTCPVLAAVIFPNMLLPGGGCSFHERPRLDDTEVIANLYSNQVVQVSNHDRDYFDKIRQAIWSAYFTGNAGDATAPPHLSHQRNSGKSLLGWLKFEPSDTDAQLIQSVNSCLYTLSRRPCPRQDYSLSRNRVPKHHSITGKALPTL